VTIPGVHPFFGDEAIVVALSQVARWLDKTLARRPVPLQISMVNRRSPINAGFFIPSFMKSFLPLTFVSLDDILLFLAHFRLLNSEFFHALVGSPRPFESCRRVALRLPFFLQLPALGLTGHLWFHLADEVKSGCVRRILRKTLGLKAVVLLLEFAFVELVFLQKASKMVLRRNDLCFPLNPRHFMRHFGYMLILHINLGG
jgi:hypothetical protein